MAGKAADTGSHDDATKGQSSSSTADVYSGELTPLQRHVAFFDRDKDGVIYPSETYQGFRAIGCGVALSAASAVFINAGLGPSTKPENQKTPPFKFPIYVKNIHKGKHGSDSGVYDANGRYFFSLKKLPSVTIRVKPSDSSCARSLMSSSGQLSFHCTLRKFRI
ncbi:hypothetical protein SETIT_4G112000v2 [Setaria italica]|uniref:EF-hand domain-containing protein n=1 Tax=Setaria italica TaxID=4555 RepID=A0A368QT28_SETIT|nr:hypothetical protein SETIT_4G112000v2 [Setaria italica]